MTNDERTWSIQNANLTIRFDYVLPCALLFSNITSSQVFRSDLVFPSAPPMMASDSATAADHLPVVMTFRNPYDVPLIIRNLTISNHVATLRWATIPGDRYRVETSADLIAWQSAATDLIALTGEISLQTSANNASQFFRIARER